MKKLLVSIVLGATMTVSSFAAGSAFGQPALQVASASCTGSPLILSSNNIIITSITILSTNFATVRFYDTVLTNAPYFGTNYTTAAYVSPLAYATNIVTSFVGYNGYTNFYTNSGWATVLVTNGITTNALPAQGSFATIPNVVASYDAQMTFSSGATVYCSTNAQIIYYYRLNR